MILFVDKMNKKILLISIPLILFLTIATSSINAISYDIKITEKILTHDEIKYEPLLIENGIVFGRTIMNINYKPCGPLEFVNISFYGEETKNIKSGLFGFFIARIPLGKYLVIASKYGFESSFTYVNLFRFKPFAITIFKLEKIGWN